MCYAIRGCGYARLMTASRTQQASTWHAPTDDVAAFLADFDNRRTDGGIGDQFAENFLAVDPNSVTVLTPAMLAAALPLRRRKFQDAGISEVCRRETRQLELDERHLLVAAEWDADRPGQQPIRLESTFLLRRDTAGLRILVYLNHHDVAALLGEAAA